MEYAASLIGVPTVTWRRLTAPAILAWQHVHDHFIPNSRNNYHPHILGHRVLGLFSALLVAVKIFTISALTFGPVLPAFSEAISTENIITLTNSSRQQFNLAALAENNVLDKAAQAKADDMLAKGYFSHNTPDGHTPWDFINGAGYNYIAAGENLAVNFTQAEDVETAWMNSPGHKANILNGNYQEIGVGISQGQFEGHAAIFVVQMFGTPAEQKIALSAQPTQVQLQGVPQPKTDIKLTSAAPEPVSINNANTSLEGNQIHITAQTSANAIKVLAHFGQSAIMLQPVTGSPPETAGAGAAEVSWSGYVEAAKLAAGNLSVSVEAVDIKNNSASLRLADFSNATSANFQVAGANIQPPRISLFGINFAPTAFAQKFYLLAALGLLCCLTVAIGIKRHIQHLSLVMNTSLVVMLTMVLWLAG